MNRLNNKFIKDNGVLIKKNGKNRDKELNIKKIKEKKKDPLSKPSYTVTLLERSCLFLKSQRCLVLLIIKHYETYKF